MFHPFGQAGSSNGGLGQLIQNSVTSSGGFGQLIQNSTTTTNGTIGNFMSPNCNTDFSSLIPGLGSGNFGFGPSIQGAALFGESGAVSLRAGGIRSGYSVVPNGSFPGAQFDPAGAAAGGAGAPEVEFSCPSRPDHGNEGIRIQLRVNHFRVRMSRPLVYHYDVTIQPEKCPRRVNREVLETMVQSYSHKIFNGQKPVFDGRKNLYSTEPLPIGREKVDLAVILPGDWRDREFKVSIKWVDQVSLLALENILEGRSGTVPFDSIQALDVIMRHLPSMTHTPVGRSFFTAASATSKTDQLPLGGGREVWFGFHQSIRPSLWKMMLNIDVSATAFYKSQSVMEFMDEVLETGPIADQRRPLSDSQRVKFTKKKKVPTATLR